MAEEFSLTSPGPLPRQNGGKRPGAGRPRKVKEMMAQKSWRAAGKHWPDILEGIVTHALRVKEIAPPKTALAAATWLGDRFWPEPRGAPVAVNIAQLGGASLVEAIQAGELTASDAAALLRARSQTIDVAPAEANGAGAREELAKRLMRAIAQRSGESPST